MLNMLITVTVKPNAKKETIEMIDNQTFRVSLKESPQDGKANSALIKILAKHLRIPQSRIMIKHGATSRKKIIEII